MKCPACGAAHLVMDTRDIPVTYQGATTVVSGLTADFCSACGEFLMDAPTIDRYSALVGAFRRRVDKARAGAFGISRAPAND